MIGTATLAALAPTFAPTLSPADPTLPLVSNAGGEGMEWHGASAMASDIFSADAARLHRPAWVGACGWPGRDGRSLAVQGSPNSYGLV